MRMAIDQSRKHGGMGKIDNGCSRRNGDRARRRNTLNAISNNDDHYVVARFVACAIKKMSRANIEGLGCGSWCRCLLAICRRGRSDRQKNDCHKKEEREPFHPKLLGKNIGEYIRRKAARLSVRRVACVRAGCSKSETYSQAFRAKRQDKNQAARPTTRRDAASGAGHTNHVPESQAGWSVATN